jgi:hypothetical protein
MVEPCPGSCSIPGLGAVMGQQKPSGEYTDKKENQNFLIYKEI